MAGATIPTEVPDVGTPVIDPNGYINVVWHDFFFSLLRRTGGSEGLVPLTSLTANLPLVTTGGTDPIISINNAAPLAAGAMSGADKVKLDSMTSGAAVATVSGATPITSTGGLAPVIGITPATTLVAGSMSAADKVKLDGVTPGAGVASVGGTAPIVSSGGTTPTISITAATTLVDGSMSAADKVKLNGIGTGATVTGVTGAAPIVSSGGAAPAISITAATGAAAGSMSAADKTKLDLLDYQTGTWTPTLTFATPGNLAVTYNNRLGFYTKIGRKVSIDFTIGTATWSWTTGSGAVLIQGLPFTANSGPIEYNGAMSWNGISVTGFMSVTPIVTSTLPTTIQMVASGNGVARGTLAAGNLPSGGSILLVGHIEYFV